MADHLQQLALAIRALLLMRFKFNERKRFVQITLISIWNDLDSFMDSFGHVKATSGSTRDALGMRSSKSCQDRSHEPSIAVFSISECFPFPSEQTCTTRPVQNLPHL